ncbi:hypothetical protein I5V32_13475 [Stenotrophomonas maltophilia]|uniref:Uncharacterized protein n=1 Tax=Stenotrophomonas maltophilia TaxID=40324 RepID=A0AA41CJC4_STEMA|nr:MULTISPECIES: hypothetical protein [Stenotrophomonas]AWB78702.1 hypothetical protein B7H26_12475 [Stenotrophomonas maltophilia]KOO70812.1 hypothetical protein VL21_20110 [Stenotrophomonas maltophilia]MBH1583737.1 hypothetical protein [Stenotrophomonas maltophilia]MBH1717140.1 hypothetical protein [Stenotrophomonas maltophilia]MBH1791468.1 hypothetical protein [Stenotrophomonas maltophilia]
MRFIYVLLFILLTGAALFSFRKLHRGELGEKPVYAALQRAELEYRRQPVGDLIYEEGGGHLLAGFSIDAQARVWVALDTMRDNGDLFVVPMHGEQRVPCQLVDQLVSANVGSAQARHALKASCVK